MIYKSYARGRPPQQFSNVLSSDEERQARLLLY